LEGGRRITVKAEVGRSSEKKKNLERGAIWGHMEAKRNISDGLGDVSKRIRGF